MESSKNDFTRGSIPKKMLKFMVPVLGALVLQAMYGAVDILVVFTVTGLSMGITVLIGRYIGEKQERKVGKVIGGPPWLRSWLRQ